MIVLSSFLRLLDRTAVEGLRTQGNERFYVFLAVVVALSGLASGQLLNVLAQLKVDPHSFSVQGATT